MTRLADIVISAAAMATVVTQGAAHLAQLFPITRQWSYGPLFKEWDDPDIEYCPHCYNSRGPKYVRERAKELTDPEAYSTYGNGEFPLLFSEMAENGNYLEPQAISVRHGVCGDPEQNEGETSNVYSTPNSNWPVIDSFTSGQVIEIVADMNAYHWGHVEFFVCNTADMENSDGVVTQECLNKHPLTRASDDGDASPIDPNFPGRYYVDPECRASETFQDLPPEAPEGYNIRMRYLLPDIECDHCVMQMVYYTGNTCKHVGYDEFEPESWPSDCAPNKSDWIELNRYICGTNGVYPEEFWNCADISIIRDGTAPASDDSTSPSPTSTDSPELVSTDTASEGAPVPPPTPFTSVTIATTSTEASSVEFNSATDPMFPEFGTASVYEHLGCFMDSDDDRILGHVLESPEMTPDLCLSHCNTKDAAYMATQFGEECWCSRLDDLDFDVHGAGQCDIYCTGDKSITCGGFLSFDLYKLHWPEPSVNPEYVGCYANSEDDSVMGEMIERVDMTPSICREHCEGTGSLFYGTQYGKKCWCSLSDELEDYEQYGEGVCHVSCPGKPEVACGGIQSFSLFKFASSPTPSSSTTTTTTTSDDDTSDGCSGEAVAAWEQCGGSDWSGSTCCVDGYECKVMGSGTCYSECRPVDKSMGDDDDDDYFRRNLRAPRQG